MASSDDNNTIVIEIAAEVEKLKAAFKRVEDAAEKTGTQIEKSLSDNVNQSVSKGVGFLRKEILALGAAIASAFAFKKMISEAIGAENALNDLQGAMRAAGQPVQEASSRFAEYAASLQNITTVSDDAIISSAAMLVSIGRLQGEGLERATKAALDLSAGLNISLDSAMERIARAANGNTTAFEKLGFNISKSGSDASKFSEVLAQIEQRFDGLAEGKVNTFSGAMAQMGNRFNDILETLGKMVTQSPVVIALVKALGDVFLGLNTSISSLKGDVVGNLIKSLLAFSQNIVTYVIAPLELLYNLGNLVFNALKMGGQAFVVVAFTIGNAITQAIIWPLEKALGAAATLAGFASKDIADKLNNAAGGLKNLRDTTSLLAESSNEVLADFEKDVNNSAQNLFNFDVATKASDLISKVQGVAAAAKPAVQVASQEIATAASDPIVTLENAWGYALDGVKNKFDELRQNAVQNMQQMGAAAVTSIGQGVGGAFAAMGKAMAQGKNGLKAFADAMLATLGQAAVQAGTNFILTGAAYTWAGMPNGPPLMAAGAALAAFGGILSGLGGGGASEGSASSGGGLANSSDFASKPQEREMKETGVQVIVQGNVLDRRETGLAIAETLSEFFNTSDGRLVKGFA